MLSDLIHSLALRACIFFLIADVVCHVRDGLKTKEPTNSMSYLP